MGTQTFAREDERLRRRDLVAAVGVRIFGQSWQTPLAEALSAASGRPLGRARISQWYLAGAAAKPVPEWVLEALPAIARNGAAHLRKAAAELDALFADEGAPPAQGEPEAEPAAPQESGPAVSALAEEFEDGFDMSGFLEQVHSEPPRDLGEMPMPAPVPPRRFYSSTIGWVTR